MIEAIEARLNELAALACREGQEARFEEEYAVAYRELQAAAQGLVNLGNIQAVWRRSGVGAGVRLN